MPDKGRRGGVNSDYISWAVTPSGIIGHCTVARNMLPASLWSLRVSVSTQRLVRTGCKDDPRKGRKDRLKCIYAGRNELYFSSLYSHFARRNTLVFRATCTSKMDVPRAISRTAVLSDLPFTSMLGQD